MVDPLPPDMLDIPASVIEQIPLGVQVIDLASLRASDRPQGQSLYPDSIIPVSSFTHGQHPDTGSAQTVETDGDHALKVAVSGGGSNNIGKIAPKTAYGNAGDATGSNWSSGCTNTTDPINTLYNFSWSIFTNTSDIRYDSGNRGGSLIISDYAKARALRFGAVSVPNVAQNGAMQPFAASGSLFLPQPLDFAAMWQALVGTPMVGFQVGMSEGNAPFYGFVSILYD